jgi:hypothetical protein
VKIITLTQHKLERLPTRNEDAIADNQKLEMSYGFYTPYEQLCHQFLDENYLLLESFSLVAVNIMPSLQQSPFR